MHKHARTLRAASEPDSTGRRRSIVELVSRQPVRSQDELAGLLREQGFLATQATLSRDLKALGIGKAPGPDGSSVYALPQAPREVVDKGRQRLELEAFVHSVKVIQNLVLVQTPPGNGQGVGRAIDSYRWPELEGSVAGDDTVLVVTRSPARARRFRERLEAEAGRTFV